MHRQRQAKDYCGKNKLLILPRDSRILAQVHELRQRLEEAAEFDSLTKINTTVSCCIEDKELNRALRAFICELTEDICTQETFVLNIKYNTALNRYPIEAVVNIVNRNSQGEYSLRGIFRILEEDI